MEQEIPGQWSIAMRHGTLLLPCLVCDRPTLRYALIGGAVLIYLCEEHRTYERAREWARIAADSERRYEAVENPEYCLATGDERG